MLTPTGPAHRAQDPRGRFPARLRRLINAGAVAPMRINADVDAAGLGAGDRVRAGSLTAAPADGNRTAHLYVIGGLWWGDYTGDDVTRSNHRCLLRAFPDQFVYLDDAHHAHGLALLPGFEDDTLTGVLIRLSTDYPLYDEDDHTALIAELADDMWPTYLTFDVAALLRTRHDIDCADVGVTDDELRDLFLRIHSQHYHDEYAVNAVSVCFPSLGQVVADIAAHLRTRAAG